MTQAEVLQDIASYGAQAGFWAAAAFPIVSAFYWPWWRHLWGVTIVAMDVAIALALVGDILVIEFGLVPGSTPGHVLSWVEAIALCLIPCIIVWRAVLTWITQRGG